MFWQIVLEFLTDHWQDLALGSGIAFNCLHRQKTEEEKQQIKHNKAKCRSAKLERKLHRAYEKEAAFEEAQKNE